MHALCPARQWRFVLRRAIASSKHSGRHARGCQVRDPRVSVAPPHSAPPLRSRFRTVSPPCVVDQAYSRGSVSIGRRHRSKTHNWPKPKPSLERRVEFIFCNRNGAKWHTLPWCSLAIAVAIRVALSPTQRRRRALEPPAGGGGDMAGHGDVVECRERRPVPVRFNTRVSILSYRINEYLEYQHHV